MKTNMWAVAMVGAVALLNGRTVAAADLEPLVIEQLDKQLQEDNPDGIGKAVADWYRRKIAS